MKEIVYVATHVEKLAYRWPDEDGASTKGNVILCEEINIEAPTLSRLIDKIGEAYFLEIDDVFIPGDDKDNITSFGFNRLEDEDSNESSESDDIKFLCDYTFGIEKRVVEALPISKAEFDAEGITNH